VTDAGSKPVVYTVRALVAWLLCTVVMELSTWTGRPRVSAASTLMTSESLADVELGGHARGDASCTLAGEGGLRQVGQRSQHLAGPAAVVVDRLLAQDH
jgi:hypothetical protein